jgi:hypothetical protein
MQKLLKAEEIALKNIFFKAQFANLNSYNY